MEHPSGGRSILVVDDTTENLRLLCSILAARGYEARPVTSGPLALEAAASSPPEIILLDINMPGMDGLEVCARLKQHETLREIPVIFLTALTDTSDKVRAFSAGGVDYITKPFQIEEVLARVDVHLQLRRSRAHLQSSYDRLHALERMRDDLTNMIVHDLRSPIGAVMMTLEFLQGELRESPGASVRASLQSALQAASRSNRLVEDLLDVARMEDGRMPIELEPTDLVETCRAALATFETGIASRRLELVAEGPLVARCDAHLVRRVVENLVGNASKHTPSTGRILVTVSRRDSMVRLEVQDEGRGIPPEARGTIFDRYATLAARRHTGYHSTGLGLTFCKLVVEAHGGSIGVEDGQTVGSVFWVELPSSPA